MPKLILVVDDETDIVEIVREMLEGAGYETAGAYDGKQAIEAVARRRPDAIVLDIKMPVMDGFGVIRHLRQNSKLAPIQIVVLTATHVLPEIQEQYRDFHVSSWIAKPFEPAQIIEAVAQAIGEKNNG